MTYLYAVGPNGSTISGAFNFQYNGVMDGKDSFTFMLPNYYGENYATWTAQYDGECRIVNSTDNKQIMRGHLKRVIDGNPMQLTVEGYIDQMTWFVLPEDVTDMKLDELVVVEAPDTYAGEFNGSGVWTNNGANTAVEFNGHTSDYELDDAADYVRRTGLDTAGDEFEFWFALEHADCDYEFLCQSAGDVTEIRVYSDTQMLKVTTGDGTTNYENIVADQWYHVKIIFSYVDPLFINGAATVKITKNGSETTVVNEEIYINGGANMNDVELHSSDAAYNLYIDAPALSSDEGYSVGDNKTGYYYNLYLEDQEGDDPGLANDQYNTTSNRKLYAIISDNTLEESGPEEIDPIASSTVVYGSAGGGDETDLTEADQTNVWRSTWSVAVNDWDDTYEHRIDFGIQSANIPDTADISKIVVNVQGECKMYRPVASNPVGVMTLDFYLSANDTLDVDNDVLIGSVSKTPTALGTWMEYRYDSNNPLEIILTQDDNDNEVYFTKAGNEWNGGYLFIKLRDNENYEGNNSYQSVNDLDFARLDIYYTSETFDPINQEVYDTIATDHIQIYNTAVDDKQNLDGKGIATGDTVSIGVSVEEAFDRCFQGVDIPGLEYNIRDGTAFSEGIAEEYGPMLSYQLFTKLCEKYNLHYWVNHADNNSIITAMRESDVSAASVTYSTSTDIPSDYTVDSSNNEYGSVQVAFHGGLTAKITASTPSTNPKTKFYNRKDILTLTSANDYALLKAEELSSISYHIHCEWEYLPTNIPVIGTKYSFTLPKWNGSAFTTVSYTNQICRAVVIEQDGGAGPYHVSADFGTHHTDDDEFLGRAIAKNEEEIIRMQSLAYTSANSSVTRHAQLDGIGSNDHHTAYTDADVNTIVATHTSDVDAHIGSGLYTALQEGALPYGESNKVWFPLVPYGPSPTNYANFAAATPLSYTNLGTTGAVNLNFILPIPTKTSNNHLVIDGVQVDVSDCDADDEVQDVRVYALNWDGTTTHFDESLPNDAGTGDILTPERSEMLFSNRGGSPGDLDCTNYQFVFAVCRVDTDDARDLDIVGMKLQCWYEAD